MTIWRNVYIVLSILLTPSIMLASDPPTYVEIRRHYENLQKNDVRALPNVNRYIAKAKKESNYTQLVQGYRDAVLFNASEYKKLSYSDSMIGAALQSRNKDLVSVSYLGKGIIYYYNFKKFKPALDEYVKAYQYSKSSNDEYLKHKVIYHLGMVKNYLGYYEDAIVHFKECSKFFDKKSKEKLHPNEIYNNRKGYINSLHQLTICYGNTLQYTKVDSIISLALAQIDQGNITRDFRTERNYFIKSRGILNFYQHNYEGAVADLKQSLPAMIDANDYEWMAIINFYLGRSYLMLDDEKAIGNFEKVDSLFTRHHFVVPRIRSNYEYLIDHYKKKRDLDRQLYYTKQLLKADSLISKDFTYLSLKIHKEYDRQALLDEKRVLERANLTKSLLLLMLFILISFVLILFYLFYRRKRNIEMKYKALQDRFFSNNLPKETPAKTVVHVIDPPKIISDEIANNLIEKLKVFEESNLFIKQGLTENKLAGQLKTNTNYLSKVINQTKGMNFNRYIADLRIKYITKLLYTQKKYLNYTIESLAGECGFATRQSFSDQFFEINGIRPKDFIKRRKEEVQRNEDSQD